MRVRSGVRLLLLICFFVLSHCKKSAKERKARKAYREGVKAQSNGDLNVAEGKYREALRLSKGFFPDASWNLCHIYQYKAEAGPAIDVLREAYEEISHGNQRALHEQRVS